MAGLGSVILTLVGLAAFVSIGSDVLFDGTTPSRVETLSISHSVTERIEFIAVGDINLGRGVGQRILEGDTLYPFLFVKDTFLTYDVVFGNLESPLSDQGGETQHPRNNLIFTGPPAGAYSLAHGGITVVSTANNHALDYGIGGLEETMTSLKEAGLAFSGTTVSDPVPGRPVAITRNGLSLFVFSCTDLMNSEGDRWKQHVTPADTGLLFSQIRQAREEADFIILSYHGGREYSTRPTQETMAFARASLSAGVDLFLGHHPHVPQGIEQVGDKVILYSLGNFVFRQPFDYWTQRSFAFAATISKNGGRASLSNMRCLPVLAGDQPRFLEPGVDAREILDQLRNLSPPGEGEVAWLE
jgi:poly-gamma-glutamate synthesis protein (capsule biosynthesis protein)